MAKTSARKGPCGGKQPRRIKRQEEKKGGISLAKTPSIVEEEGEEPASIAPEQALSALRFTLESKDKTIKGKEDENQRLLDLCSKLP